MAKEYAIIQVALPVGHANYPRPGVVICVVSGTRKVVAVSTKLELFRPGEHFMIPADHPDFPATGLSESSYAIAQPFSTLRNMKSLKSLVG